VTGVLEYYSDYGVMVLYVILITVLMKNVVLCCLCMDDLHGTFVVVWDTLW
jgi:hypothetical protein